MAASFQQAKGNHYSQHREFTGLGNYWSCYSVKAAVAVMTALISSSRFSPFSIKNTFISKEERLLLCFVCFKLDSSWFPRDSALLHWKQDHLSGSWVSSTWRCFQGALSRDQAHRTHTAWKPYKASSIWNPNVRGSHINCTKSRQPPRGSVSDWCKKKGIWSSHHQGSWCISDQPSGCSQDLPLPDWPSARKTPGHLVVY